MLPILGGAFAGGTGLPDAGHFDSYNASAGLLPIDGSGARAGESGAFTKAGRDGSRGLRDPQGSHVAARRTERPGDLDEGASVLQPVPDGSVGDLLARAGQA